MLMIYLSGCTTGPLARRRYGAVPELGTMMGPGAWCKPWTRFYACDNDAFIYSELGSRPDPAWWQREGETKWLKMLDKIPDNPRPLFCALPDVVCDWPATLERAHRYRQELIDRNLPSALVLQDGCDFRDVFTFAPNAVFIGGSRAWKFATVRPAVRAFSGLGIWIHVGRVNGERPIRFARRAGANSCDGTGLQRHWNAEFPNVLRGLRAESPQLELF